MHKNLFRTADIKSNNRRVRAAILQQTFTKPFYMLAVTRRHKDKHKHKHKHKHDHMITE
jgi:hypothetical protein